MNIGIDLRALTHGTTTGVTVYIRRILEQLPKVDKKNQYYLWWNARPDSAAQPPQFRSPRFKVVKTHYSNTRLNLRLQYGELELDRLILRAAHRSHEQLDALWLPDPRPIRVSAGCRLITTIHDRAHEVNPRWFSWRTRLWHQLLSPRNIAQQSNHILTPSQATKKDIMKHWRIPGERITATPLGAPQYQPRDISSAAIARVREKYRLPPHYVLTLGTLEPRKNLGIAARAMRRIVTETDLPHHLVVAGQADPSIFGRTQLGSAPWLHLPGFIDEPDKPALFAGASLFLAPSLLEGFDLPVVEALAAGTRVIASNIPVHREVAGIHATYIHPRNSDAWYVAIRKTLGEKITSVEKKKRMTYAERFTWAKTSEHTLTPLTAVSGKGGNLDNMI